MNSQLPPTSFEDTVIFKGSVSIGTNWLISTYGSWPLGQLVLSHEGIELKLEWKKERLRWADISRIEVRHGKAIYVHHDLPEVSPYLVFYPRFSDCPRLSELMAIYGFLVEFASKSWF